MLELTADAHERPARVECRTEDLEERSPPFQRNEQLPVDPELVLTRVFEQFCASADIQPLLGAHQIGERRPQRVEEPSLARRETRIVELSSQTTGPESEPDHPLVEVFARPLR